MLTWEYSIYICSLSYIGREHVANWKSIVYKKFLLFQYVHVLYIQLVSYHWRNFMQ